MKNALKYLAILGLALATLTLPSFHVISTEGPGDPEETEGEVVARQAYNHMLLENENGEIPADAWDNAIKHKEKMEFLPDAWTEFMEESEDMEGTEVPSLWESLGPGNIGGRTRAIVIHPSQPDTIWVGSVTGGVWKTTNGGTSWFTTTDFLPNVNIRSMIINPSNPNVLYAGTGEAFQGNGIYKTTNGGTQWVSLPSTNNANFYYVNRMATSADGAIILAATDTGVYRSTDAGGSWSPSTTLPAGRWADVRFKPYSIVDWEIPDVPAINCLASTYDGRVYWSGDLGVTWSQATIPGSGGYTQIAYSRSSPWVVYASLEEGNGAIYRSDNGGYSFVLQGHVTGLPGIFFWANALWVNPTNPNFILVGGQYLMRSTDAGVTWDQGSTGSHLDHHVVVEHPGFNGTTNKIVFNGDDGGIYKGADVTATSMNWTNLAHGLKITQFYGGAGHVATGKIIGGSQDNGTLRFDGNPEGWNVLFGALGGDGGYCAVDQTSTPYFYGEFVSLQIYRSTDGAISKEYIHNGPNGIPLSCNGIPCAEFIAPFVLDPNTTTRLLGGGDNLWRTNNAREPEATQVVWTSIKPPITGNINITAIAVAPGYSDLVWVGYKDGSVYYTTNGTAVTPTWTRVDVNGLPHGTGYPCTRITIGPSVSEIPFRRVYVTFGGFHSQSDNVWKTEDHGQSWDNISNGLPQAPAYSLVISPTNPSILYLGTEVGIFASSDAGGIWSPGAPGAGGPTHAAVKELFWMNHKLIAATHGRGMFRLTGMSDD